jgi:hypothetical protein
MYTRSLVHSLQGKRPIRIPGHRWKDNIKIELSEIVCEDTDWIHLAQDKF